MVPAARREVRARVHRWVEAATPQPFPPASHRASIHPEAGVSARVAD